MATASQPDSDFDYVIVGAGSAGAVLAARLSDDPTITVCLIEAGGTDRSPIVSTPLGVIWLSKDPQRNWLYKSTPQEALDDRVISVPRGRLLGGSSAINGMIYIRGHRADYDAWAAAGNTGWGYDDVLPYFRRSEANTNPALDDALHGRDGPLTVSDLRDPNPADHAFVAAAERLQMHATADFNNAEPEGVGIYQVTQKDGRRHSTAAAFLAPLRGRANLHVETGAVVTQIAVEAARATGVVVCSAAGAPARTIRARAEVILCAGAIGSPDILLRSGIGPAAEFSAAGIDPVADLPGVGRNLQDHVDVMVICRSRSTGPWGISARALPRLAADAARWLLAGRGMLSSNLVEAGGFVRSQPSEPRPDIQFHLIPGRKSHRGRMLEYGHGVSLHTCVLRPESRGSVTRTGPRGAPVIDLGLLTHDDDMARLLRGVKLAREILGTPPLADLGLSEIVPGEAARSDEALRAHIRAQARTVYHPVGTCAMGIGTEAVVTPRLKVRGIDGLRVVDASIMPTIVSGNTNAPTIMIAEKAADMIVEDRKAAARPASGTTAADRVAVAPPVTATGHNNHQTHMSGRT